MAGKSKAIGEELYNKCNLELKKHGINANSGLKENRKGKKTG